jgi:hypothetical protein
MRLTFALLFRLLFPPLQPLQAVPKDAPPPMRLDAAPVRLPSAAAAAAVASVVRAKVGEIQADFELGSARTAKELGALMKARPALLRRLTAAAAEVAAGLAAEPTRSVLAVAFEQIVRSMPAVAATPQPLVSVEHAQHRFYAGVIISHVQASVVSRSLGPSPAAGEAVLKLQLGPAGLARLEKLSTAALAPAAAGLQAAAGGGGEGGGGAAAVQHGGATAVQHGGGGGGGGGAPLERTHSDELEAFEHELSAALSLSAADATQRGGALDAAEAEQLELVQPPSPRHLTPEPLLRVCISASRPLLCCGGGIRKGPHGLNGGGRRSKRSRHRSPPPPNPQLYRRRRRQRRRQPRHTCLTGGEWRHRQMLRESWRWPSWSA